MKYFNNTLKKSILDYLTLYDNILPSKHEDHMEKSVFNQDYTLFLSYLRYVRQSAGLTQKQVAERIQQTQSFVSKCERGERRIDVIELLVISEAMGISMEDFIHQLKNVLE